MAENFRNEAKKLGMNVLGFDGTEERANFSPMIIPLKAKNPDLVYFGGIYHQGGLLLKQLREKGVKAKFMGPDGLDSAEMAKIAGPAVIKQLLYQRRRPTGCVSRNSRLSLKNINSASARRSNLSACTVTTPHWSASRRWSNGSKPMAARDRARAEVSTAVRKIKNFKGVTGSIEFDNKGDPVKAKYFVLQFEKQVYPGKVVKVIEQQAPAAVKKS